MRQQRALAPDQPFLMYWAPGGVHAPHHIFKEWADKYKGTFDGGWDAMRERVFARQKELGYIPADTKLNAAARVRWPPGRTFPRRKSHSSGGSWRSSPATPSTPTRRPDA